VADSQTLEDGVHHAQTNLNDVKAGPQIQDVAATKGHHARRPAAVRFEQLRFSRG
jgi:hypothetical protein